MNTGPDAALNMDGKAVAEEVTGFRRDGQRLQWSPSAVFSAACVMNSFGVINFSLLPVWFMVSGGGEFQLVDVTQNEVITFIVVCIFSVVFLLPYAIGMLLFGLPVFCLQAFLGQFSGTGLIAAYRIAPLYKGNVFELLSPNISDNNDFSPASQLLATL